MEDALTDPGPKSRAAEDLHLTVERRPKVHQQAAEVQQAASGLQVHHQVNGTTFGVFLPKDRPDDRNVRCTTSCRNGEELLAVAAEVRQMGELSHVGIVP